MKQSSTQLKKKDKLPTTTTDECWIYAYVKKSQAHARKYKKEQVGKWMVFIHINELDLLWKKIKRATERGNLGIQSKSATAWLSPLAKNEYEKVICIYTYNWMDEVDVFRVEKALRQLGIQQTLFYKSDADSIKGKYQFNTTEPISKYVSKATITYKNKLSSLYGIGEDKEGVLRNIGIKSVNALLAFDTSKKLEGVGISNERIIKLKLAALSQIENRIYCQTPFKPPKTNVVYYDIETDLNPLNIEKRVWSIAVYYKKKVTRFFAENWTEEKNILSSFLAFLKTINNPQLVSYSGCGFDKTVLQYAFKRYDLDTTHYTSCLQHDLCTLLRRSYFFPTENLKLKQIGAYLGYPFKSPYMDGVAAALTYICAQRTQEDLPKSIFHYIDDDVKAMDFIVRNLSSRKDIKCLFD